MSEKIVSLEEAVVQQGHELQQRTDELKAARRKQSATARKHDTRVKIIVGSHQLSLHGCRLHNLPIDDLRLFRDWLEPRTHEMKFLEEEGVDFDRLKEDSNGGSAKAETDAADGSEDRHSAAVETDTDAADRFEYLDLVAMAKLGSWVIDQAFRDQAGSNLRQLVNRGVAEITDIPQQAALGALVKRRHKAYKAVAHDDEANAATAANVPEVDFGEDEDL